LKKRFWPVDPSFWRPLDRSLLQNQVGLKKPFNHDQVENDDSSHLTINELFDLSLALRPKYIRIWVFFNSLRRFSGSFLHYPGGEYYKNQKQARLFLGQEHNKLKFLAFVGY
jgi:hypothetical protein